MDWRIEMSKMLATFERQAVQSLGNMRMALNGQPFKPTFREYFLRVSNNSLTDTFDQFEMGFQMYDKMFGYTSSTQNDELAASKSHHSAGINMNKNSGLETGASNGSMGNVQNQNDSADVRRSRRVNFNGNVANGVKGNFTPDLNISNSTTKGTGKKSAPTRSMPKKRFSCTVCDYVGLHMGNLNRHMRTHTGEKPHRCKQCGKRFTMAQHLKKHALAHTDVFPFHCKGCSSGFLQKAEKEAHEKVCSYRRYECHLCKKFVTPIKTKLKEHMLKHTGEKPFRCEICMKHFTQKGYLKRHLDKIHTRINS